MRIFLVTERIRVGLLDDCADPHGMSNSAHIDGTPTQEKIVVHCLFCIFWSLVARRNEQM